MVEKSSNYAAPAMEKGLDVLELLARRERGLTKSEIARELGRSVSEIFRTLHSLEKRSYIVRQPDDRYTLTMKLFQLATEHPPTERLLSEALPVMHRLAEKTLQSCHLAVLERSHFVILGQVNAPSGTGFHVKPGSRSPLTHGASGYVILACCAEATRQRALAEWKEDIGRPMPKNFAAHLAEIRRLGYEDRPSHEVDGITDISFPVVDGAGLAIAALTIPYIHRKVAEISKQQVMAGLKAASVAISTAISGVRHLG
ncbi:IclR family transcriptional regulator [Granulicella arctica]|uniref:IclR family transcriptional regulator n=1 Tax=Granulicella arctica TaxID=940613 RepID=UPI0021E0A47F|nr:IclR family transcriptional regulator [Granulicella arctica]